MIRAAVALLTVAVVSCSLAVDADGLNEGCLNSEKRCDGKCVPKNAVEFGCAGISCLPCFVNHATPTCSNAGECVVGGCNRDFDNCDGDSKNGCEAELNSSNLHCGECGTVCTPEHAEPDCAAGICAYLSCHAGFADCDGDRRNGCEASLSDEETCGDCNIQCTPAQTCGGPSSARVCQG